MKRFRFYYLFILICGCLGLIRIVIVGDYKPSLAMTLSPFFQHISKPVKSVDRAVSQLLPLEEIDEEMLGIAISKQLSEPSQQAADESITRYLNTLIRHLTAKKVKNFNYTVFLREGPPNASALPGGVILITESMFNLMSNEAELVFVLSHEIGHIERGHVFDAARGEMLQRKIVQIPLVTFALDVIHSLANILFSKAQEDEADEYAFKMLLENGYNPFAASAVFNKLAKGRVQSPSLFQDLFNSHPYDVLRQEKFLFQAKRWSERNGQGLVYNGVRNLVERKSRYESLYSDEYGANTGIEQ